MAGVRCLYLEIVSRGSGGSDFCLGRRQTGWLRRELDAAGQEGYPVVESMQAYPGDLFKGADPIGRMFADNGVRLVGTGHTHNNEVLNHGRVVYAATRSTGQIEEDAPGFSLGGLDSGCVSWRFNEVEAPWPFVSITSPSQEQLVTDSQDRRQVLERNLTVRAKVFGREAPSVSGVLDGAPAAPLEPLGNGVWQGAFAASGDGLHRLAVIATGPSGAQDTDEIDALMRNARERPKRGDLVAPSRAIHALGAWPRQSILGSQLGPNRNYKKCQRIMERSGRGR